MPREVLATPGRVADIINGNMFTSFVNTETVADDGTVRVAVKTNGYPYLCRVYIAAGGLSRFRVYEAASLETAGTNMSLFNRNRSSALTSVASVSAGNSHSNGTVIFDEMFGSNAPGQNDGPGEGGLLFSLAKSEHYVFEVQNLSGSATMTDLHVDLR